jgi:hypothetical protein
VKDHKHRASEGSEKAGAAQGGGKSELEALRQILLGRYIAHLAEMEAQLDDLERRVTDEDALIATVAPVLGDAIRRRIRDAREEMIESLYPIIGQVVVRAVAEAIRDLARTVDAQVRTSLNPQVLWWRVRARLGGASGGELLLRESLPFRIAEVFLIHRQSGLLLLHISGEADVSSDSDLIGSMLTAIRDFAQDAFGRGKEAQLDEIEYGGQRILIEAARHAYLAVVVDGVEPPGFRAAMRERIIEIEHAHEKVLRDYEGDPTPLAPVEASLSSLMVAAEPRGLSRTQRGALVGVLGILFICLVGTCIGGRWVVQTVRRTPTPTTLPIVAQATPSPTLTASPSATPSPTLTSTATPTVTPTPAPVVAVMTGHVWVRQAPAQDAPLMGVILERGQPVELQAVFGDWYQVRWTPEPETEVIGWVPMRWVGTTGPIPARIVTPTIGPS